MYEYIRGVLEECEPLSVVIDVGGIGYQILIPPNHYAKMPAKGKKVKVFTSFIVREQSQTLYGFLNKEDRSLFEVLTTVSGIGPKTALGIVGSLESAALVTAVRTEDIQVLCKVPGIGKKTAERLIIEIRDKLPNMFQRTLSQAALPESSQTIQDALNALINLGYTQNTAQNAMKKTVASLGEESDLATMITTALKNV